MKKQAKACAETIPLSSPSGSSDVQLDHDFQKVSFKSFHGNGHAAADPNPPDSPDVKTKDPNLKNTTWILDTNSQADDNSTDPPETMTETSTLTLWTRRSWRKLSRALGIYLKEFVLIDDEETGTCL
ncbi:hypothetical protein WMY93_004196 [Mugilogobius chulae]|uniref:Uncharacterized protein n=1 Tax=Mugilogobius chulae TaxID=88201 RepID=A0AAW0PU99_9GOBI